MRLDGLRLSRRRGRPVCAAGPGEQCRAGLPARLAGRARGGDAMPFCVGAGASARADAGGELRLRINDTILFDNDGSVVVVVETSAP